VSSTALPCVCLLILGIDVRTLIFELPAVNAILLWICIVLSVVSSLRIRGLPVLFSVCICTQWRVVSGMSDTWFGLRVADSIACCYCCGRRRPISRKFYSTQFLPDQQLFLKL
jgi:hypothetical protein